MQPGETLTAFSQTVHAGGKGLNQSIALAKAGAEVYHAGCIGTGGGPLEKLLRENHVNTAFLKPVEELQGNAVIQVTPSGENCIVLFGGSNQCVTPQQIEETLSFFAEGDYLVLQNEINELPLLVERAYERGMKIVLNPSPCNDKLNAVDFGKLDWLFINEVEASQLSGRKEPEEAWKMLHQAYPNLSILITLGRLGSIVYRVGNGEIETIRQKAFSVPTVDTTAAGDTFTGFFIGGLTEEMPLETCMRRASMAAAICVTRPGAAGSIPTREEVEERLKEAGWQK